MSDGIIQTYTGKAFSVLDPDPAAVCIEDIAHALAHICRYNGHCSRFYSVAEHSAWGAAHMAAGYGRAVQRAFLLHDAAEAYIGDICTPVKAALGSRVHEIEAGIMRAIHERFGIGSVPSLHIAEIDRRMLGVEVAAVMGKPLVGSWPDMSDLPVISWNPGLSPENAKAMFLAVARQLGIPLKDDTGLGALWPDPEGMGPPPDCRHGGRHHWAPMLDSNGPHRQCIRCGVREYDL